LILADVEQQEYFLIFAEEPGLHRSGGDQEKDSYADKRGKDADCEKPVSRYD
jgi:hypothetical protein